MSGPFGLSRLGQQRVDPLGWRSALISMDRKTRHRPSLPASMF